MKILGPAEAYRAASAVSSRGEAAPCASLLTSPALPASHRGVKTDRVSVSESFLALHATSSRAPASAERIAQLKMQFEGDTLATSPEATAAKLLVDEHDSFTDCLPARG